MKTSLSLVFLISILVIAGCQPSRNQVENAAAQTQAIETAFEAAIAGAQTQAARQLPTAAPSPTASPGAIQASPTYTVDMLALMDYLNGSLQNLPPGASGPYDVKVVFLNYRSDAGGNRTHMDVGIMKSDATREGFAHGGMVVAFSQIYADPSLEQNLILPAALQTYEVYLYDSSRRLLSVMSGAWADMIAFGRGSLTPDELMKRISIKATAN